MSVKFKDLPYKRPDLAAIKAQINQKAVELESSSELEEQIRLILAVEQLYLYQF